MLLRKGGGARHGCWCMLSMCTPGAACAAEAQEPSAGTHALLLCTAHATHVHMPVTYLIAHAGADPIDPLPKTHPQAPELEPRLQELLGTQGLDALQEQPVKLQLPLAGEWLQQPLQQLVVLDGAVAAAVRSVAAGGAAPAGGRGGR